jgi:hypothetical protein
MGQAEKVYWMISSLHQKFIVFKQCTNLHGKHEQKDKIKTLTQFEHHVMID